jgi:diacylglycerol kinase family enzyme
VLGEVVVPTGARESSVAFVLNGNAGSVTPEICSRLGRLFGERDVFVSKSLEDVGPIADRILRDEYDTVLVGGGDGTFTVMVTEITRRAREQDVATPRLGVLKLGTGNAMAKVAGPDRSLRDISDHELLELARSPLTREIRMVEVEGFLTPFAGLGADAEVLADYIALNRRLRGTPLSSIGVGLAGYSLAALTRSIPKQIGKEMPFFRITNLGGPCHRVGKGKQIIGRPFAHGEVIFEGKARIASCSTIPYYGFGLRMFPFADIEPDRMHLRVSTMGSLEFAQNIGAMWNGSFDDPSTLFDFLIEAVKIECDPATELQIGGDAQGKRSVLEMKISDQPLRLVAHDD